MPDIKERIAEFLTKAPDDVTGAVVLTKRADGHIDVFGTGGVPMTLNTLGLAVALIAAKAGQAAEVAPTP